MGIQAARPSASFVTMPGRISTSCPFLRTPYAVAIKVNGLSTSALTVALKTLLICPHLSVTAFVPAAPHHQAKEHSKQRSADSEHFLDNFSAFGYVADMLIDGPACPHMLADLLLADVGLYGREAGSPADPLRRMRFMPQQSHATALELTAEQQCQDAAWQRAGRTCKILPPATPPFRSSTSEPGLLTSKDRMTII